MRIIRNRVTKVLYICELHLVIKLFDFYPFWIKKDKYGNFERPENFAC